MVVSLALFMTQDKFTYQDEHTVAEKPSWDKSKGPWKLHQWPPQGTN
jgi:hypothetical protein